MGRSKLGYTGTLVILLCFCITFVISTIRLAEFGMELYLWLWIGVSTMGTFIFLGPALWLIRGRVNPDRYGILRSVTLGFLFVVSTIFTAELNFRDQSHLVYATMLGATLGYCATFIVRSIAVDDFLQLLEHK